MVDIGKVLRTVYIISTTQVLTVMLPLLNKLEVFLNYPVDPSVKVLHEESVDLEAEILSFFFILILLYLFSLFNQFKF
jgi:hypothetical protein